MDGSQSLVDFAGKLEQAALHTVEEGIMTGDLAAFSDIRQKKVVNTENFIKEVNKRLITLLLTA